MKLSPYNEIWRVLKSEPGRYAMHAASLEIEDGMGRLVATNGRALAVVPVELSEGDEPGLVPREAIGAPPQNVEGLDDDGEWYSVRAALPQAEIRVRKGGSSVTHDHKAPEGEFPKWNSVLPAADAPGTLVVKLSTELLHDLARAIGAAEKGVTLRIPQPGADGEIRTAIRVEGEDGAVGAIMPILLHNK